MSIWAEAGAVIPAIFAGSAWKMRDAFYTDGMWIVCFFITLFGGILANQFFKRLPFMDKHLERGIAVTTYLMIAAIIFWGVIDRFIFSNQWSGSTTVPPFLFMIMAWFGCSYNVRLRTHLSFSEFRTKMRPAGQMAALSLDGALWFGFCWIAITTSLRFTVYSADNFQLVDGVDNTMKWWFYITVPVAFVLMSGRVVGNWLDDFRNYRAGKDMLQTAVIGGDV
ncbi:TRAP transporter small permease subunit [Sulfitobacter sp. M57]|uniref:TRAP transporter small permease n=1 Tax=unclassified Sulfitobacter TaxID=196795 RepID=UPI0023E276DD|nr:MULTISPECIES: TRAP transporter small permease subunit [unclassified Sulfitobacter]MDF3414756.1 TRAP transporter small permease subunit [Sulfitobacter sp. KE5]MDF3422237.1 TRAP transporter small permease subunit [Sulfitobacter sp. KE43]MDF3433302.1 TRAP transporter small permease subunit [Sulfitobacter sp. KE42]MDF3458942.1 TRAP transporter small permease subunit [Sulfitobacter sp. S74]MDF3462841.1 TRAP transporter small permease subunit [Sulfitobacter sp. Ks18]